MKGGHTADRVSVPVVVLLLLMAVILLPAAAPLAMALSESEPQGSGDGTSRAVVPASGRTTRRLLECTETWGLCVYSDECCPGTFCDLNAGQGGGFYGACVPPCWWKEGGCNGSS
ncbi:hypothetical protein PAHAL_2G030700 [Panicum hallii]|uniref:Uncharacterized protein n=1 Tax=Panicum hallii TaxID=206008 RepID=A0A2T8KMN6_9POAL|nr:hypothetical protein PAHAL_2G030700 [Panicum hallii]